MNNFYFFSVNNDYTGSCSALKSTILSVLDNDEKVTLITTKASGHLSDIPGVNYIYKSKINTSNKFLVIINYFYLQLLMFFDVFRHVKNNNDTIVVCNTLLCFSPLIAARLLRLRALAYIHESYVSPKFLSYFSVLIIRCTKSYVFLVSNYLKEFYSFNDELTKVVYNCSPFPISSKLESSVFTATMLCSPRTYKGVDEFFIIASQCPDIKFQLILACRQSESYKYISKFEVSQNVTIIYSPSNLQRVYQDTSVVLNLSRVDLCVESFGMTIIEGFSFGIPAIVPPVGGPSELISHNKNGFLVDSRNHSGVVSYLQLLKNDKVLYSEMCENARNSSYLFINSSFVRSINSLCVDNVK